MNLRCLPMFISRGARLALSVAILLWWTYPVTAQTDSSNNQATQLYWVFLTTGKPTVDVPTADIQEMQEQHLANFSRLYEQGNLLAAGPIGPMSDRNRSLRGIVVLSASDAEQISEMFKPDPYIQHGYMKVEASPMRIVIGEFHKAQDEGMDEWWLVLGESTGDTPLDTQSATDSNREYYQSALADSLRLAVELDDRQTRRREILIIDKIDEDAVAQFIADIPTKKSDARRYHFMPLYTGKGILK